MYRRFPGHSYASVAAEKAGERSCRGHDCPARVLRHRSPELPPWGQGQRGDPVCQCSFSRVGKRERSEKVARQHGCGSPPAYLISHIRRSRRRQCPTPFQLQRKQRQGTAAARSLRLRSSGAAMLFCIARGNRCHSKSKRHDMQAAAGPSPDTRLRGRGTGARPFSLPLFLSVVARCIRCQNVSAARAWFALIPPRTIPSTQRDAHGVFLSIAPKLSQLAAATVPLALGEFKHGGSGSAARPPPCWFYGYDP